MSVYTITLPTSSEQPLAKIGLHFPLACHYREDANAVLAKLLTVGVEARIVPRTALECRTKLFIPLIDVTRTIFRPVKGDIPDVARAVNQLDHVLYVNMLDDELVVKSVGIDAAELPAILNQRSAGRLAIETAGTSLRRRVG